MLRSILTVADDLTGALEVGAKFAAAGLAAPVTYDLCGSDAGLPLMVIDTETRHHSPEDAGLAVRRLAERLRGHAPEILYKKTDSTLRGNIASELRALMDAFPDREVIYVPAYPAMGRTVVRGQLFVDGVPVHSTAFAADALNPIRSSTVREFLGGLPAIIFDGESDEDVLAAARRIVASGKPVIVAGPAAIGGALATLLPFEGEPARCFPPLRRCLVVNGSVHPASAAQMAFASDQGCVDDDRWQVFRYEGEHVGVDRALRAGECVKAYLEKNRVDALIVFGGDTAVGIHQALGAAPFDPYGEVVPGVPLSQSGGLSWITKAGGFGVPSLLCDVRKQLS